MKRHLLLSVPARLHPRPPRAWLSESCRAGDTSLRGSNSHAIDDPQGLETGMRPSPPSFPTQDQGKHTPGRSMPHRKHQTIGHAGHGVVSRGLGGAQALPTPRGFRGSRVEPGCGTAGASKSKGDSPWSWSISCGWRPTTTIGSAALQTMLPSALPMLHDEETPLHQRDGYAWKTPCPGVHTRGGSSRGFWVALYIKTDRHRLGLSCISTVRCAYGILYICTV
jgi:hypothetical protein